MKNILIGLLLLGSYSAYAEDCLIATKNIKNPHILQMQFKDSQLKDSNLLSRIGVATQYGVERVVYAADTGLKNAFGEKVTFNKAQFKLYEAGTAIFSTDVIDSTITNESDAAKLVMDELKRLGCS